MLLIQKYNMILIRYKSKFIKVNLIFGILWLLIGIVAIAVNPTGTFFEFGFIILSIGYFTMYFLKKYKHYGIIEEREITMNGLLSKKILTHDIIEIKEFAGDVIFKTSAKEIAFDTNFIEEESLLELKKVARDLMVEKNLI